MSCDLLPTDRPGNHYEGDVRDVIDDGWDLMICHPPCKYLSGSGIHWNNRGRGWLGSHCYHWSPALLNKINTQKRLNEG